jgi:hypothetical protein
MAMVILVLQLGLVVGLSLFDQEEVEAKQKSLGPVFHPTANLPVIC